MSLANVDLSAEAAVARSAWERRPLTPRQREIVDLAAGLADDFAETAAVWDRENRFPTDNWDRMRDEGYLRLCLPEELGGLGAGIQEFFLAQERLAAGDGATALAVNMHHVGVIAAVSAWRRGDERSGSYLRGVADGKVVFAGCTSETGRGGSLVDPGTKATRVDGGFTIVGRKSFFTGHHGCTFFHSNARYDDPDAGPQVLMFRLPIDAPKVTVHKSWDTLGMRGTQSDDLTFDGAFVPDEEVSLRYPVGTFDQKVGQGIFGVNVPSFGAVFLGVAGGAVAWGRAWVIERGRERDPEVQHAFAEMEVLLETARAVLYRQAHEVDSGLFAELGVQDAFARGSLVKHVAATNAVAVVELVSRVLGGVAYHRRYPVERLVRDVRAGPIMPLNSLDTHRLLGETSLGIVADAGRYHL